MSQYLINIVATSNFAAVISADTEATLANVAATELNTDAQLKHTAALSTTELRLKKKKAAAEQTTTGLAGLLNKIRNVNEHLMKMSGASDTVGYNLWGLSLRIGKWVIPALIILGSSMLPIIASLLAMGAAAGVAGLGLLSMVGLGAALMSHRFKQVGNINAPEGFGQNAQTTIWTQLFKPIWAALDSPELKGPTENAVLFVQTLFGDTIPKALKSFLNNIDPGTMLAFETLFQKWLPDMAGSLTRYGSQLFNVIGTASLSRLNDFFKWMADGIMGISQWLSGGGWTSVDGLTGIIKDVISTLMGLGETALPFLISALGKIWPNPLKPMIEAMTGFFEYLNGNEGAMNSMVSLVQLLAILWAVTFAVGLLAPLFGFLLSPIGLNILAILALVAAGFLLGTVLLEIVFRLYWFGDAVVAFFTDMCKSILSALMHVMFGTPYENHIKNQEDYWKIMTGEGTDWRYGIDSNWQMMGDALGGAKALGTGAVSFIKLILTAKPDFINVEADKQANQAFGTNVSWEVANNQFRRGASV